jgi:hypothetical protein
MRTLDSEKHYAGFWCPELFTFVFWPKRNARNGTCSSPPLPGVHVPDAKHYLFEFPAFDSAQKRFQPAPAAYQA